MKYEFNYPYPPRPERAVLPGLLSFYEDRGWVGQIKKNGTCTIWGVSPDKQIVAMNRHNEVHKAWKPPASLIRSFSHLTDEWHVFAGELLHSKTKTIKDTLYLFDVLVVDGEYLVGETFISRYTTLVNLFRGAPLHVSNQYIQIDPKVWIANNFKGGFAKLYKDLKNSEDEGLVLKNPNARLEPCAGPTSNNSWQVKCRKGSKNYGF